MFVHRNGQGQIDEAFTCKQVAGVDKNGVPVYRDLEEIPEDHEEVIAYRDRPMAQPEDKVEMLRAELEAKGVLIKER